MFSIAPFSQEVESPENPGRFNATSQGAQISLGVKDEFDYVDMANAFVTGYASYGLSLLPTVGVSTAGTVLSDLILKPTINGAPTTATGLATDFGLTVIGGLSALNLLIRFQQLLMTN